MAEGDTLTRGMGLVVDGDGGMLPVAVDQQASSLEATPADDLADRFRRWYLEFSAHKTWKDWLQESDEDLNFYVGGKGQWGLRGNYEDYERLVQERRAAVSMNHIQSIVDVMSGYEIANRLDLKAMPQGNADAESARLMSWFLKFAQEETNCQDELSEMFEDGNITGLSCIEVGVDYTGEKPVNGEITLERLRPGREIIWDPHWRKYDLSDCRAMLKFKWAYVTDLKAEYPEWQEEIESAAQQITGILAEGKTSRPRGDAYGTVRNHPVENLTEERNFFDPDDQRMLIIEGYYRVYYTKYSVFDRTSGQVRSCETHSEASALKAADPEHLEIHRQESRKIRMGVVLPAAWLVIEEDKNPYPNDDSNYPFVPYIGKRKGDAIYGVVRNLKDPQRIENKRWAQVIDTLSKWAMLRPLVPKGSLVGGNPQTLSDASSSAPIEYDPTKGTPGWYHAPVAEITKVLETLALAMKINMREISGINTDVLGLKQDTASGIAIARRQQQGQIIATVFFDHFRKTRRLVGQRLARRIQQVYTTEDTVRLTNEYGEPVLVRINPPEAKEMSDADYHKWAQAQLGAGKPQILRDVTSLKYEVVISDAPATPTARAASFMGLLELAEKVPQIVPIILDKIVELADVSGKEEILARLRKINPMFGGQQGPAPPNPGAAPEQASGAPGQPTEVRGGQQGAPPRAA